MPTESSQWRKFLQPVVTGLVALMAAGVGYLQYLQRGESEKRDSCISVLEVQMSEQVKDMDKFKVLLYDIRSDAVSSGGWSSSDAASLWVPIRVCAGA